VFVNTGLRRAVSKASAPPTIWTTAAHTGGPVRPLANPSRRQLIEALREHAPHAPGTEYRTAHLTDYTGATYQPLEAEKSKSAVYDGAMGLFRSRAKKKLEKAAAELPREPARTAKAQAESVRREVTAEARPNPDEPGWGQAIGQQIGKARGDRASRE
jgi:hypothetical protein